MSFLSQPLALTVDEFRSYVASLKWAKGWHPQFMVLHNTAEPNLAQWEHFGLGHSAAVQRAQNLNHYYANHEGWHSGPQIFVAPDFIIVACDLEANGVHASCYNRVSIGLEMVGDYAPGHDNFNSGLGAKVRDNAIAALEILHKALHIDPATLHFHRDCARDAHVCPGLQVDKATMISSVKAAMGTAPPPTPTHGPQPVTQPPAPPTHRPLVLDGEIVSPTQAAVAYKVFWFFSRKSVPGSDAKLTTAHAAGFVANSWGETRLQPLLWGDQNSVGVLTAYGLFQLHRNGATDRLDVACKALGLPIPIPPAHGSMHGSNDLTLDQYLAATWYDLTHGELAHLQMVAQTKTAAEAGMVICARWERAGAHGAAERRGLWAEKWLAWFLSLPNAFSL